MSRIFEIDLTEDPGQVIGRARIAAKKNSVDFEGTDHTGTFEGHGIKGQYSIDEGRIQIQIVKKPLIMPWTLIESTLRSFFEERT